MGGGVPKAYIAASSTRVTGAVALELGDDAEPKHATHRTQANRVTAGLCAVSKQRPNSIATSSHARPKQPLAVEAARSQQGLHALGPGSRNLTAGVSGTDAFREASGA